MSTLKNLQNLKLLLSRIHIKTSSPKKLRKKTQQKVIQLGNWKLANSYSYCICRLKWIENSENNKVEITRVAYFQRIVRVKIALERERKRLTVNTCQCIFIKTNI